MTNAGTNATVGAKPRRPRNVPEKQWNDDVDLINEDGTPYTG